MSDETYSRRELRRLALKAVDLAEAGRSEPALALMRRVLALQKADGQDDVRIEVWKARVLHLTGSSEQAAAVLMSIVRQDPDSFYAWLELGQMYVELNRVRHAQIALSEAMRIDPDACTLTILAGLYTPSDPDKAIEAARKALSLRPGWKEAEEALRVALRLRHQS